MNTESEGKREFEKQVNEIIDVGSGVKRNFRSAVLGDIWLLMMTSLIAAAFLYAIYGEIWYGGTHLVFTMCALPLTLSGCWVVLFVRNRASAVFFYLLAVLKFLYSMYWYWGLWYEDSIYFDYSFSESLLYTLKNFPSLMQLIFIQLLLIGMGYLDFAAIKQACRKNCSFITFRKLWILIKKNNAGEYISKQEFECGRKTMSVSRICICLTYIFFSVILLQSVFNW